MATYGYVRVSTVRQASEGESLDVQKRRLDGYAMQHGFTIDEIIVEEGVSGSVPVAERPAGAALFAKLKAGDVILAAKLDRLFRSALDALQVVEVLKRKGVGLHLLDLGGNISNGLSRLFFTIASAFAEAERDRIRERITDVKRDQRERGRFLGGVRPFGYHLAADGSLVEDAVEQVATAKMRALRADGLSLRAIASALLAEDGIRLSHAGVKKVLSRGNADAVRYPAPPKAEPGHPDPAVPAQDHTQPEAAIMEDDAEAEAMLHKVEPAAALPADADAGSSARAKIRRETEEMREYRLKLEQEFGELTKR